MTIEEGAEEYIQTEEDVIEDKKMVLEKLEKLDTDTTAAETVVKNEIKQLENGDSGISTRAVTITQSETVLFNTVKTFYAGKLGTTTAGTDMTKIAGVLNTYQSRNTYKYLSFTSKLVWRNRVAMNTRPGIPTVMDITTTTSNWRYKTNGHFLNTAGFDCRTTPETVWICDPHPQFWGVYKSNVDKAFTVNNAHFRKVIIW